MVRKRKKEKQSTKSTTDKGLDATWKVSDKNEKRKYLFVRFNTQMYQCNFKSWQKNKSLFGEKQSLL